MFPSLCHFLVAVLGLSDCLEFHLQARCLFLNSTCTVLVPAGSAVGRDGRQSWLNWALEQYTAILIAAAPPLEEMALVLPAWSCVQLQHGSLPTDTGIHGVVVLPVGPAPPASTQGGLECCTCGKKQCCGAGRASWLIPGRLVCRNPCIFFG